ncbi:MAG: 23S rRNA (pseudouridine(1915)-N(3))-methyltransferase RlmH [Candidatus Pelagibacterales bacterium]|jgi:23S rRNA (pseudouridine1915-N3)-methyltransferase|tara:strand:- start:1619 stop:2047 length:429 start_codon:yes stop_codon:yes gene_type:complete
MKIQVLYLDKLRFKSEKILADTFLERIQGSAKKLIDPIITKQITIKEMDQELDKSNLNVLLDEKGKYLNSVEFADFIFNTSHKKISFFIGSTLGFSDKAKEKAGLLLSISPMTLTHSFATIILLEQIYRATTIKMNHPYHKI